MSGGKVSSSSLKILASLVAFVLACLVAAPLAIDDETSPASGRTSRVDLVGALMIGYLEKVDSLNPYVGLNDVSRVFYGLVYDCLQSVGQDLEVTPNLARSWYSVPTSDSDMAGMPFGSIWQYNLTRNASWSDGTPFTADDVVFSLELGSNPNSFYSMWATQPYEYFMHDVWKVDNYTVRISFWDRSTTEPMPCSYANLLSVPILQKHLLEQWPYSYIGMDWTGTPVIGTGPFMATDRIYDELLSGDHITLVRNPNYHQTISDSRLVKFDQLTMKFFSDSTSMVLALKNSEIDVAAFPPTAYESINYSIRTGQLKDVSVFDGPKVTQYWTEIAFNMRDNGPNPSRLDPIVRQALHMATNKQGIIDNYYLGLGEVGTTLISPVNSRWHYEPNATEKAKFAYNLTAASALLEANGYIDIDSDGIRECTILSPAVQVGYVSENKKMAYEMLVRKNHPEEKDVASYLKAQWAQIGVVANYLIVDPLALASMAYSYSYDSLIWSWSGDVDPNFQLFVLSSYAINGWSDCSYSNPEYDQAYRLSVTTVDPQERKHWVDRAQSVFYNDGAYIILSYVRQGYAWRTDTFTGWGNWSEHPGLSIDNHWSANPLFFELNNPWGGPTFLSLTASPDHAKSNQALEFIVKGTSALQKPITFTIDFGDGEEGSAISKSDPAEIQEAHIYHRYSSAGVYSVVVTLDDGSDYAPSVELTDRIIIEEAEGVQVAALLAGIGLAAVGVAIAVVAHIFSRRRDRIAPPI